MPRQDERGGSSGALLVLRSGTALAVHSFSSTQWQLKPKQLCSLIAAIQGFIEGDEVTTIDLGTARVQVADGGTFLLLALTRPGSSPIPTLDLLWAIDCTKQSFGTVIENLERTNAMEYAKYAGARTAQQDLQFESEDVVDIVTHPKLQAAADLILRPLCSRTGSVEQRLRDASDGTDVIVWIRGNSGIKRVCDPLLENHATSITESAMAVVVGNAPEEVRDDGADPTDVAEFTPRPPSVEHVQLRKGARMSLIGVPLGKGLSRRRAVMAMIVPPTDEILRLRSRAAAKVQSLAKIIQRDFDATNMRAMMQAPIAAVTGTAYGKAGPQPQPPTKRQASTSGRSSRTRQAAIPTPDSQPTPPTAGRENSAARQVKLRPIQENRASAARNEQQISTNSATGQQQISNSAANRRRDGNVLTRGADPTVRENHKASIQEDHVPQTPKHSSEMPADLQYTMNRNHEESTMDVSAYVTPVRQALPDKSEAWGTPTADGGTAAGTRSASAAQKSRSRKRGLDLAVGIDGSMSGDVQGLASTSTGITPSLQGLNVSES